MSPSLYATICAIPVIHLAMYLCLYRTEQAVIRFQQILHATAKAQGALREPNIDRDAPEFLFIIGFRSIGIFLLLACLILDLGICIRICFYLRQIIIGQ
jgi:hypothetical protein